MNEKFTGTGSQPSPSTNLSTGAIAGLGVSAVGASGFLPYKNKRVWDTYLGAIRAIESGSPASILKTFRISETLSPLEKVGELTLSAAQAREAGAYSDLLGKAFGPVGDISLAAGPDVVREVTSGGKTIGMGVSMAGVSGQGDALADYYGRVMGIRLPLGRSVARDYLRSQYRALAPGIPFNEWAAKQSPKLILGVQLREEATILGQRILFTGRQQRAIAKAEVLYNLARARAALTAGRLNVLLSKPADIPVVGGLISKLPFLKNLTIEPGTHLQMLGRYAKKGLAIGAAWKGLEYLDYLRSEGSPMAVPLGAGMGAALGGYLFKKIGTKFSPAGLAIGAGLGVLTGILPRFEHGIFHGLLSYGADVNVARAQASEATGLSESLREQEDVTPGLISGKTAIGFSLLGALGAGTFGYASFLGKGALNRIREGGTLSEIFKNIRLERANKFAKFWQESRIGKALTKVPGVGKYLSKIKSPMMAGALVGLGAWGALSTGLSLLSGNPLAAIPGVNLLGTEESPEELQAIYSGEQEVAVKKNRYWEMGRQDISGTRTDYFRPHFLARLKSRAYQKGIWGNEEEKYTYDPMLHPLQVLFGPDEWKYHQEIKDQYTRGAPLSGTYGEEIPFVGPLVAATIGKALKPRKLIRPKEWQTPQGDFVYRPEKPELEPAYELGGLLPGAPVSPEDPTQTFNKLLEKRRQAIGLPGFISGSIQKELTGREEVFQNLETLGAMGGETGSEYWLYKHLNLGGAALASESVRRFITKTPSYWETYNPLENKVPSWYPKSYFIDVTQGNPFEKFPEYEIRGAGPGYEALNPELQGLSPEEYPLIHRLKILGNLFPYSNEFRQTLARARRTQGEMSPDERDMLATIVAQNKEVKTRKTFSPYRFTEEAQPVSPEIFEQYSKPEIAAGALWERVSHGLQTPLEYLTPLSPASKFINQRSAIESYIQERAVGTKSAFWDSPIENFLEPTAAMAARRFGSEGPSASAAARNDIEQYFDMLKWVKEYKLEQEARASGQYDAVSEHRAERRKTLFGVNPFSNPALVLSAMPRGERDYFSEFAAAQTDEARQEILNLVPDQMKKVYAAQWMRDMQQDIIEKKAEGKATDADLEREQTISAVRRTEGLAGGDLDELERRWMEETGGDVPFADWLRLLKAKQYFATHSLPDPSWLGFNPAVDLEDIKLKYIEGLGGSIHDFDLWNDRATMTARKPYINEELLKEMNAKASLEDVLKLDSQANSFGKQLRASRSDVTMHRINGNIDNEYDIEIRDGRKGLIEQAFKRLGA